MQSFNLRQLTVVTALAAAALTMAGTGVARAAGEISYSASTAGIFGATGTNSFANITFNALPISGTTVANSSALKFGTFVFGPSPTTPSTGISIGPGNQVRLDTTFDLILNFSAPVTIGSGQTITNSATVKGTVTTANTGNVKITFSSLPTFNYANTSEVGSFTLKVNEINISPNESINLSGELNGTSSPVPELSTVTGMGALLAGGGMTMFGGVIRRRRKNGTLAA